ncbi:MAG: aspartate aminotransferase family protein [Sulfurovum sp.]|nr:aspartate aminotransferase family protein [Sulfurovaceae bacterium]
MNLIELDKKYILNTYAKSYINFSHGISSTLYSDGDGKDYIDFASGIGVNSVGHANDKLTNALCEQAKKIIHISNLQVIEPQVILAKKIVELSGFNMGIFFANSGAEANEGAIKLARKYGSLEDKKRYKVITLEHSFHGRTITTVKATGQESFHNDNFSPYPDGFGYVKQIKDIYKAIDDETVAVMLELVQGEGGVEPFDREEVKALSKYLKENDILLIIDEVQSGVYRTGEFLASNLYGITPDIISLAKGLGGGVPIGAVMTSLKDLFVAGDHGSTFGGNYLSSTAGLTVLNILSSLKENGDIDKRVKYFGDKVDNIAKSHQDLFSRAVGLGFMRGLRVRDGKILAKIMQLAIDNQLVILKAGRNTVRFLPSITIRRDEIDEGFKRFDKALSAI